MTNCAEIERLLALEDGNLRLDRDALSDHFRRCQRCAAAFLEIPALLETLSGFESLPARAAARHKRALPGSALAAAALLLLTTFGLLTVDFRSGPRITVVAGSDSPPIKIRRLPLAVSTVENRTVRIGPNRQYSTITRRRSFRPGLDPEARFTR